MKSHIILIAALVLLTIIEIGETRAGYYGYHGYGYRSRGNRYRSYGYGKRGMKKIASRQQTSNVHAELNDDSKIEHLKENFAEDERHKAQLKAPH